MRLKLIALATACLVVPHAARAELTIQQYQANMQDPAAGPVTQILIEGIVLGISAMVAEDSVEGNKPFICQPDHLALTGEQDIQILNQWIHEHNPPANDMVEVDLLMALEETFPCK